MRPGIWSTSADETGPAAKGSDCHWEDDMSDGYKAGFGITNLIMLAGAVAGLAGVVLLFVAMLPAVMAG
jgi:hypothetical protein